MSLTRFMIFQTGGPLTHRILNLQFDIKADRPSWGSSRQTVFEILLCGQRCCSVPILVTNPRTSTEKMSGLLISKAMRQKTNLTPFHLNLLRVSPAQSTNVSLARTSRNSGCSKMGSASEFAAICASALNPPSRTPCSMTTLAAIRKFSSALSFSINAR